MDVSHRLEVCDNPAPTPGEVHMFFKVLMARVSLNSKSRISLLFKVSSIATSSRSISVDQVCKLHQDTDFFQEVIFSITSD